MRSNLLLIRQSVFKSLLLLLLPVSVIKAQNTVGIGTETPNSNAVLHLQSTANNQGLLIPSMSTAQRTASSFTDGLNSSDNGLMVFDLSEKTFYFWNEETWQSMNNTVSLTAGSGIAISGNTISNTGDTDNTNEIQDLRLTGNNLTITNNTSATEIDLSPFSGSNTDNQNLSVNSTGVNRNLSITGGTGVTFSVADNDNSNSNEIQNLSSVLSEGSNGGGSRITNIGTPTNNTDAATKGYVDGNTFSGSFNDLSGIPSGLADGDDVGLTTVNTDASLTGNGAGSALSIANNAITTAKIANNAVNDAKISGVSPGKIAASGASTGQVLRWNGSSWAPQTFTAPAPFTANNIIPKGNGSAMVNSRIFDDGSYIGFGRSVKTLVDSYYDFEISNSGSSFGGFILNSTSPTGQPYLGFSTDGNLQTYIYTNGSGGDMIFGTAGTVMTLTNERNVGLGTTAPSAKLDVIGSTELNGSFATPALNTTSVSGTNFNITKPTRRIIRLSASASGTRVTTMTAGDDGQEVILINTGTNFIEIQGGSNPVNANSMVLDNFGVVLGRYSTLHLIYDGNVNAWLEISRSINDWFIIFKP